MAEVAPMFSDSAAYERFMAPWSRAAGAVFLDWLAPPTNAHWLDVGCGTGVFTQLLMERCLPTEVFAIDPVRAQIDRARHGTRTKEATFQIADAQSLPFVSRSFDIIVSALVLNFIPDCDRALAEMRRVARADGTVAAYVWDFGNELSPSGPFRAAIRHSGFELPEIPGASQSSLDALRSIFEQAGLVEIATRTIDVTVPFAHFGDFWRAQTSSHSPTTRMIAGLSATDRAKLAETVRCRLPVSSGGSIRYAARANAIKARAAG